MKKILEGAIHVKQSIMYYTYYRVGFGGGLHWQYIEKQRFIGRRLLEYYNKIRLHTCNLIQQLDSYDRNHYICNTNIPHLIGLPKW